MELFITLCVTLFGLIVGSFLNVVILRLDTGLGFGGRSKCFSCGKTLHWYELIPLLSFLFQQGKCRGCKSKISWQYPAVELLTSILFILVWIKLGGLFAWLIFLVYIVLLSSLMVISVFDIRHHQIPTIPLLVFYASAAGVFFATGQTGFLLHIGYSTLAATPLLLLWLVSRGRWLGFGDVLLAFGIALWLGFSQGFASVLLAFWIGAVFAILLMLAQRKKLFKMAIPFGPFLALGAIVSFLYTIDISSLMEFFSWI